MRQGPGQSVPPLKEGSFFPGASGALLGAPGRSWALLGAPGCYWALLGAPWALVEASLCSHVLLIRVPLIFQSFSTFLTTLQCAHFDFHLFSIVFFNDFQNNRRNFVTLASFRRVSL